MNLRFLFFCLLFSAGSLLAAQSMQLETKSTSSGTEILIRANTLEALRTGLLAGWQLEAETPAGAWRRVTNQPLRARYRTIEAARGQNLSLGEVYLYRFVLFAEQDRVQNAEQGVLLPSIYRRLAQDRAGLQRSGLWAQDAEGNASTRYRLLRADGAVLATSTAAITPLAPACSALKITPLPNSQSITLSWPNDPQVVGWYVLKSVAGAPAERLEEALTIYRDPGEEVPAAERSLVAMIDSLPPDGQVYTYQLLPVDHFGSVGQDCPTATITGKDLVAPALPVVRPAVVNAKTNEVQLSWEMSEGKQPTRQRLLFSDTRDGDYEELAKIPLGKLTYTDRWPATRNRGFYQLELADEAGNITLAGPIFALRPDIIPPAVPTGLTADLAEGVVTLAWTAVAEDKVGYRLRSRRGGTQRWTEIMRFAPAGNIAYDTLPTTLNGGTLEYQLSAYDWIGNESDFGQTVSVVLPDNVPPVAPVISGLRSVEDSIGLGWRLAAPAEVQEVIVAVAASASENFTEVRRLPAAESQLLLTGQKPGTYAFRLRAVDAAGNESEWSAPRQVTVLTKRETLPSGITAISHRSFEEGRILLQWEPADQNESSYLVYRQNGKNEAQLVGTTAGKQFSDVAPAGTSYFLIRQGAEGQAFAPSTLYTIQ
ncbi:MAG: fibronectin type III domain-containing protein [Bacteroidota bacterium]